MKRTNDDDEAPESRPSLTMAEVEQLIADIARNGSGGDRLRALTLLRKTDSTPRASYMPPPMTTDEAIERLARLIKATGGEIARAAYRQALPRERRPIDNPEPVRVESLPAETVQMIQAKVRDLKSLYRIIPELKRPGRVTGFPISKGMLERQRWCQAQAMKHFADQMNLAPAAPTDASASDTVTPADSDEVRIVPAVRSLS